MYSEILSKVRTVQEASRLEEEVTLLEVALYKSQEGVFEEVLDKSVRSWVSESIKAELTKASVSKRDYFTGLKQELAGLKVVRITLAQEPTEDGLGNIKNWLISNLGEGVVIDLSFNPSILAGLVLVYEGKYVDLSLKNRFKRIFEKKKWRFLNYEGL